MKGQKKKQSGITLIALVISIIVMLILAGVSINATIGENGIVKQAQKATYLQSCAVLQDWFQQQYVSLSTSDYVDGVESDDTPLSKIMNAGHTNWFFHTSEGFCVKKQLAVTLEDGTETTQAYIFYLLIKEQLPDEIRSSIQGADNLESRDYRKIRNVYGITSDLQVYYCETGLDTMLGLTIADINADSPDIVAYNSTSKLAQIVNNGTEDLTNQSLKTIQTLTIDSVDELSVLDEFKNLQYLESVTFSGITIPSVTGISKAEKLNYVKFINCSCANYLDLSNIKNLESLYLVTPTGKNTDVTNLCSNDKGIGLAHFENLEYFGIIGDDYYTQTTGSEYNSGRYEITDISALANLQDDTKEAIKYLYLQNNRISSISCLSGFKNVYILRLDANCITTFDGIQNMSNLHYLIAPGCYRDSDSKYSLGISEGSSAGTTDALDYIYKDSNGKNEALYMVNLRNNSSLKYIDGLATCSEIRYLYMQGCTNIQNISTISSVIGNCGNNYTLDSNYGSDIISGSIVSINLAGQTLTTTEFEKLLDNTNLEAISLKNITLKSGNTTLNNTTTPTYNAEINNVLKTCTSLKHVELNGCTNLNTIEFVKTTPDLISINLTGTSVGTNDGDATKNGLELLNSYCSNLGCIVLNGSTTQINLKKIEAAIDKVSSNMFDDPSGHRDNVQLWYNNTPNGGIVLANTALQASLSTCTGITYLYTYNSSLYGGLAGQMVDLHLCSNLRKMQSRGNNAGYILGPKVESAMLDADGGRGFDCTYASSIKEIKVTWGSGNDTVFNNVCTALKDNKTLRTLNFSACSITDISPIALLKDTGLTNFTLSRSGYAGFSNISALANIETLETISIPGQYVTDISPLKNLTNLKELNLSNNRITNINDLQNLSNLENVNLSGNSINNIYSLIGKKKIQNLNLQNCALTDLFYNNSMGYETIDVFYDLNTTGELRSLYISGNNIDDTELLEDIPWEYDEENEVFNVSGFNAKIKSN